MGVVKFFHRLRGAAGETPTSVSYDREYVIIVYRDEKGRYAQSTRNTRRAAEWERVMTLARCMNPGLTPLYMVKVKVKTLRDMRYA